MFNFLTYNKLKTQKWNILPANKRLKVFQKIEKIVAKSQKRNPYSIIAKRFDDTTLGTCSYSKEVISLNEDYFIKRDLQFLALATLFHEERHIHQRNVINSKKKILKYSKTYKWQQELLSYTHYDGTDKYSYYSMQEVERDANKFAIQKLKKLYFWFKHDANYLNALEEKEIEYNFVKENAKKELGFFYKIKLFLKRKFRDK